jgi:ankyrin repeat protein
MEESGPTQIDPTLCKMILNSVQEGDLTKIQSNLEKYCIDVTALKDIQKNQNAFFSAALIKDDNQALEVFKFLKSKGLSPNLKDKFEQTCLYYTCREGKNLSSKYLVEECGLNANEIDIYGQTPIYYSVRDHKLETVKVMIDLGANINIEDKYGQTCLFYAIREGHYDIVELLIEKGANVNQVDKKKRTPYSFAEKYNFQNICDLLLKNGANKPISKINAEKRGRKEKKKSLKERFDNDNEENKLNNENEELTMEDIQKTRKCYLIKIENGKKIPLTNEEINIFKKEHEDIYKYLVDEKEREKLKENADNSLLYFDTWEKQAKKLINMLWKVKGAYLFHKPVDPIELGIPDYFQIIKNPMDFSTIKKKLSNNLYTNFKQFTEDIKLTFDNCYLYNGADSSVGLACTVIKNEYQKLYDQMGMEKFL